MTEPQPTFAELRTRYADSLASKRNALEDAWQAFARGQDAADPGELHMLAHRLAGSAGSYGYEKLGVLARAVDAALTTWSDAPASSRETRADLARRIAAPMRALLDRLAIDAGRAGDVDPHDGAPPRSID